MKRFLFAVLACCALCLSLQATNNTVIASDGFQRSGPGLGANWTAVSGVSTGKLVAGTPDVVEPNATSTNAGQTWSAATWANDQCTEVTFGPGFISESGTFVNPIVRQAASASTRYEADIANGTAHIYHVLAGSSTSIGLVSVTTAAGNIFTFCAIGNGIYLYRNGAIVTAIEDHSIASGSPGFLQYSSVNITHTQVVSWTGYSTGQQDGVWQKQGIILPGLAADSTQGTSNPSNILPPSTCVVLSGSCYKMYFNCAGVSSLCYAESLDGKVWTRQSGPLLSAPCSFPAVWMDGTTYNLYCQKDTAGFWLYTSPDGLTFSQFGGSQIISVGAGGSWDAHDLYYFTPQATIAGTLYATYTADACGDGTCPNKTGIAISVDGHGQVWAKDLVHNPVVSDFWGVGVCQLVSGVYYCWGQSNQPGQGSANNPFQDPTDTLRMQTTDFITWTNPIHSIHHMQMWEGVNGNSGQGIGSQVIQIGTQTIMYGTSVWSDYVAPNLYQVSSSIVPTTISQLVLYNEDAAQQIAADSFTSGAGDLSASWTSPTGGSKCKIVTGPYVEPTALTTYCQEVYTGASFSTDQYSEISLHALGTTAYVTPCVRYSTTALTGYCANMVGPTGTKSTTVYIFKEVAGTPTQIGAATVSATPQVADVFRLQVIGNQLFFYQNGYLIMQVEDYGSSIASGDPGFKAYATSSLSDAQISLWSGGNANVIPPYSSGSSQIGAFIVGP